MERKLIALALIAAGVGVQWGPGFALITAGALFGLSGVEFSPRGGEVVRRAWSQARGMAASMPRRTAAGVLVAAAIVLVPLGSALAAGAWAAALALGGLMLALGAVLGWE